MPMPRSRLHILLLWLGWVVILLGLQAVVAARFSLEFPDRALPGRAERADYQAGQTYLTEPFMNRQVSWDAEYYLAIAVGGYDDSATDPVGPPSSHYTKSYAFLPAYPLVIRAVAAPLGMVGLNPIATATLAAVLVSAVSALVAALAVHALAAMRLNAEGAWRAACYLLLYPSAFFFVQVYSEALFLALSGGCLLALERRRYAPAALLAAVACLTRSIGIVLLVPLAWSWCEQLVIARRAEPARSWSSIALSPASIAAACALLLPLAAFLCWKFSDYGRGFDFVQGATFHNSAFNRWLARDRWVAAYRALGGDNGAAAVHFAGVFASTLLGAASCLFCARRYPRVAAYSGALFAVTVLSAPVVGMARFMLVLPTNYLMLAELGAWPLADRLWTTVSVLGLGILATLYTFEFWVA